MKQKRERERERDKHKNENVQMKDGDGICENFRDRENNGPILYGLYDLNYDSRVLLTRRLSIILLNRKLSILLL